MRCEILKDDKQKKTDGTLFAQKSYKISLNTKQDKNYPWVLQNVNSRRNFCGENYVFTFGLIQK